MRRSSDPHFLLGPVVHHSNQVYSIQPSSLGVCLLLNLASGPHVLLFGRQSTCGVVSGSLVIELTRDPSGALHLLARLSHFLLIDGP